jgi:Na+/H+-dicarboxylate symporter
MATAAASSLSKEPGIAARVIAAVLPIPNAGEEVEEQIAKTVQAVIDVAPVTAQALMETTIRQHGASPAQILNNIQIEQAIKRDTSESQS